MIVSLLLLLAVSYTLWTLACLEANVRKARAINVPVVRIPFSADSNVWVIVQPLVWKTLEYCIPVRWNSYPDFIRFSHRNWPFLEKSRPATRFGPVWAIVSPSSISLYFADPEAIEDIFSRWKAFVRPVHKYKMLAFYGPSVFTVGMDDWPRHRKAVAAPFSESLMKLVWDETLSHARDTVHSWVTSPQAIIPSLEGDLRALTFDVLAATSFQESQDSTSGTSQPNEIYRETLHIVIENAILLMLVPYRYLTGALVPKSLTRIGRAAVSFKSILTRMVLEETAALDRESAAPGGLLRPLVRAQELRTSAPGQNERGAKSTGRAKRSSLSSAEILGNVFAINFAGHDTVLIALTFTLTLLAAHPEIQEWLHDEITIVLKEQSLDRDEWDYKAFSKLNRCHAVFLETLRLYAPITGVPKITTERAGSIKVGHQVIPLSPGIEVFPILMGMQTNAKYWGNQPYEWRPSRWILHPGAVDDEEVLIPRKGTFFPWSDGPQNCVGKKFSMVESVAVLACLFHQHRLIVKRNDGETEPQARKRAIDCVNDVNFDLLLRMNQPERVRLECVKRE